MRLSLLVLLGSLSFATPVLASFPNPPGCAEATTIAQAECRGKQIEQANAKLARYLGAARKQAGLLGLDASALEAEQNAWQTYKARYCENAFQIWAQGTIRTEVSAICSLETIRTRTQDIWRFYLNFMDSSDPVLPDPSK